MLQLIKKSYLRFILSFGGLAIMVLAFYCLPFWFYSKVWPAHCNYKFFIKYGIAVVLMYVSFLIIEYIHLKIYKKYFNLTLKMIEIRVDEISNTFRDMLCSLFVVVLTFILIGVVFAIW